MTLLFDDQAIVYGTCRDCKQIMKVVDAGDKVHPTCTPRPTKVESLARGWLSAVLAGDPRVADWTEEEIEAIDTKRPDLVTAAIRFAEAGWPVFPLQPLSKVPAIPKSKGGKGCKDATADVDRIRRYWNRHPHCNIGLATGHLFDVIDIDTKDSDGNPTSVGVMSLSKMLQENCTGCTTPRERRAHADAFHFGDIHGVSVTASGGMHLFIKPRKAKNGAGIRPGVDYRGLGGYVVAPPSTLGVRGRAYSWLVTPSPIIRSDENATAGM